MSSIGSRNKISKKVSSSLSKPQKISKKTKLEKNPGGFVLQSPIAISTPVSDQTRRALSVPIIKHFHPTHTLTLTLTYPQTS